MEISEGPVGISFMPPPGCAVLPEEAQVLLKGQGVPLKYGCVTPQRDVLVMIMMTDSLGGGERGMADFERGFRDSQNKAYPEIKWLARDVVKLGGGDWVRLRYREAPAADRLLHQVYITDWAGQFVVFIMSAPASSYESRRAAMERSAKSIELSVSVIAPAEQPKPADGPREKAKP